MPPKERKRKRPPPSTQQKNKRVSTAAFLDKEAKDDATESGENGEEDESDESEGENEQDGDFIHDSPVEDNNSPSSHRALDRQRLEQQETVEVERLTSRLRGALSSEGRKTPGPSSRDPEVAETVASPDQRERQVRPYFPAAFARSREQPTHFNFEMFVFDTLTLPRGLFADDERGEVQFENAERCAEYCQRYVQERLDSLRHSREEDSSEELRRELCKEDMFRLSGEAVQNMKTGNTDYDARLDDVRVDNYGNVMILNSPHWSDASPQFTHGFPRRLIRESHRGVFFPGNLTVAARISNQAIRSMSVGDVACFISQKMMLGLGLTRCELVLARASALKYAGRRAKPSRLIDTMLRFGIDFLTLKPLTHQQVLDLRDTSSVHWNQILRAEPQGDHSEPERESSGSELSGEELEVPSGWNVGAECGDFMPGPSSDDHSRVVERHVRRLLNCYLTAASNRELEPAELETGARTRHGSGHRKRRSRRTGPIMPVIPRVSGDSAEEEDTTTPAPGPDARAALLGLPGIKPARIPTDESLARLAEYLSKNQPLAAQQVVALEGASRPERFQAAFRTQRCQQVRQAMKDLWVASNPDCMCTSEPLGGPPSQGGDGSDGDCPYCRSSAEGSELHAVRRKCTNQECRVCLLIDHCEEATLVQVGVDKNSRLSTMLQFSQHIAHILNSGDIHTDRLKAITTALCSLLCCKPTRLRNVANTGFLTLLCPRLLSVQIESGWGELWNNLSKIASAVGHHDDLRSQLAALVFVRRKCITGAENNWNYYLASQEEAQERDITETVFHGCFEEE